MTVVLDHETLKGAMKHHSSLSLRIQSENLESTETGLPTPFPSPTQQLQGTEEAVDRPSKGRRVRFADSPQQASRRESRAKETCSTVEQRLIPGIDLRDRKDVCEHIFNHRTTTQHQPGACIGYLANDRLAHHLLEAQDRDAVAIQTQPAPVSSLATMIHPSKKLEVSVPDRLQLALRLARSVLQYHSTPWWRPNWNLSDVSYFEIDSDLSASLKTLHINTDLVSRTEKLAMHNVLSDIPTPPEDDEARIQSGIRNPTLFSLGAALIQIGTWQYFDVNDIVRVRKLASLPSVLGAKYASLTAKCVWCDFGAGDDLNDSELQLQTAIYETVVCELERLIGVLDGTRDGRGQGSHLRSLKPPIREGG
ncbi:hypothetical protein B0T14DRAFT_569050 [Immersiella caudata]|uniref:DUF7580 domain-containing protein n=1 Tax=Immersiella caudata TaxID=314043 RepID=A0AA39WLE0_9PEZI|nr:hypothetical protein B0T14DRAFT_569050 [Immersiella caudata]